MVSGKYKEGQKVEYKPVGGMVFLFFFHIRRLGACALTVLFSCLGRDSNTSSSTGIIERVITEDTPAGSTGVTVKADVEHPRYEVRDTIETINGGLLTALLVVDQE